jgi:hypothetical protein
MFTAQGPAQEIENARLVLMLIATGMVVFWRVAIRVLFAIMVVAAVVGGYVLLHGL